MVLGALLSLPLAVAPAVADQTAFIAPEDIFGALREFIEHAQETVDVASYIFTSEAAAELLVSAEARGVEVRILLESRPVGGISDAEMEVLCALSEAGVDVMLSTSQRFMHAKYIVRDGESVLVSTENFVNSPNRGWGATDSNPSVVRKFAEVFAADSSRAASFECGSATVIEKRGSFDAIDGGLEAILAPSATDKVVGLIAAANETVYAIQFTAPRYWREGRGERYESPLLAAVIERARAGVEAKVLLDGSPDGGSFERAAENADTARWLNDIGAAENLSLEARVAGPRILRKLGVPKIHAKGLVIDGKVALVSSINWNRNSPENNREAGLIVRGEAAESLARAFLADWSKTEESGDGQGLLSKESLALLLLVAGAGLLFYLRLGRQNIGHAGTKSGKKTQI